MFSRRPSRVPSEFLDGPAEGVTLATRRAPEFLRVVRPGEGWSGAWEAAGGDGTPKWDCLDQLDDEVREGEEVFAYRLEGQASQVFACTRSGGGGGEYWSGRYRVLDPQPSGEAMQSTERWQAWVAAYIQAEGST